MITISVDKSPFKTIIDSVEKSSERRKLFATIRTTMEGSLKDAANSKGKRFWAAVAKSVTGESDNDSAIIGATHPAAAIRQFGGTISAPGQGPGASGAKHLAIPVNPAARGKSPRDIKNLFCAVRKSDGAMFLFRKLNDSVELFYVLKKSVQHPADPWLPSENQRNKKLRVAATAWLDSRKRNS